VKDFERLARDEVLDIKAWPTAKPIEALQAELGLETLALMGTNENPLGPSPRAMEAAREELSKANRYPQGPCTILKRKLAARLGIGEDMIVFGNGADNCLQMIGGSFFNAGDEVIVADPSFPVHGIVARKMGARPVAVPLKDYRLDLKAMAARIGPRTKCVFICNPNNPTGTIVGKEELDEFIKTLPDHVLVVLDEAYFEFVDDNDFPNGVDIIGQGHNVMVLRTFSKLYGLAGLRIGYCIADPELISIVERVREPFPVSRIAEAAALAALDDEEFKKKVLQNNEDSKLYLFEQFDRLGLSYSASHTNFVFVDLGIDAGKAAQSLLERGYLIRPGAVWQQPTHARITFGTKEENRGFIRSLEKVLAEADTR
jgi:histidinol-phosphate aminotransferase